MTFPCIAYPVVTMTTGRLETPAAFCKTYRVENLEPFGAEVQETIQKATRGEARDRGFLLHSRIPVS